METQRVSRIDGGEMPAAARRKTNGKGDENG